MPYRERLVAFRARWMDRPLPASDKPVKGRLGDILRPVRQIVNIVCQDETWFLDFVKQVDANRKSEGLDKACTILGIEGVDLYGGTKHSTATALGELLTPEQIKRGGTGSATNKAFERYFQPRRTESAKVTSAIKQLRKKNKGEVVEFVKKK